VVPIDRLPRSSEPVCQNLDLEYRILPLGHWYELVVTDARFQHLLEFRDLEMNQLRNGRIQRLLGLQPGAEQLEALAERGSDFERVPLLTPLHGLMVSRYRGGDAVRRSPRRLGLQPSFSQQVVEVGSLLPRPASPRLNASFRGNESHQIRAASLAVEE
jgi:hypothetical protein